VCLQVLLLWRYFFPPSHHRRQVPFGNASLNDPQPVIFRGSVNVGWPNVFAGTGSSSFDAGGGSQWALQGWQVRFLGNQPAHFDFSCKKVQKCARISLLTSWQAWVALTYAVVFATCMTWTLVTWCRCVQSISRDCDYLVMPASARLPGSTVALFSTLQPLFTGILGLIGICTR
jgi:hypothetical protein